MIRIVLSKAELRQLEDVLRMTSNAKLRHRAQIILMAHRNLPHQDIAAATGVNPHIGSVASRVNIMAAS
ncbi:hypothetical protein [Fimbriiglobus ruber]|uniref:Uncharacterized protein n=1 Tax=Fimbriiglobus ruber TaxID=1908690 RepID=A0A225DI17_9BACT|nr:hypothetical protein [Fimbriiglobus ruber]OWK39334.1 hypothetical protein FRUB_05897 [Fimbriiglobus ruber]